MDIYGGTVSHLGIFFANSSNIKYYITFERVVRLKKDKYHVKCLYTVFFSKTALTLTFELRKITFIFHYPKM